jgi:hypothetical protein
MGGGWVDKMPAASQKGRNGEEKNRGDARRIFEALGFVVSAQTIASLRQKQWMENLHVGAYTAKGPVSRVNVRKLTIRVERPLDCTSWQDRDLAQPPCSPRVAAMMLYAHRLNFESWYAHRQIIILDCPPRREREDGDKRDTHIHKKCMA